MNSIVFIKVESSDLIVWGDPSEGDNQPHIVQIGAVKSDSDGNTIEIFGMIVKPDGWVISDGSMASHGILQTVAENVGRPEKQVIQDFLDFCGDCDRASFNRSFDQRLIRIALKRFFGEAEQEKWAITDNYVNIASSVKNVVNAKSVKTGKVINPTLEQACNYFFLLDFSEMKSPIEKAKACMHMHFPAKE